MKTLEDLSFSKLWNLGWGIRMKQNEAKEWHQNDLLGEKWLYIGMKEQCNLHRDKPIMVIDSDTSTSLEDH